MAEAEPPYSDEDSSPTPPYSPHNPEKHNFKSILNDLLPQQDDKPFRRLTSNGQPDAPISLTGTQPEQSGDEEGEFRKRVRVGNHYQAKIPKIGAVPCTDDGKDLLLWSPFASDDQAVENFLKSVAQARRALLPMGAHLRDDEAALHALQQCEHELAAALRRLARAAAPAPAWTEDECRSFEGGLLAFGKNFFLIRKYKVAGRAVGELVQFYYLWKKTERYDLFASRIRAGKKKYTLNPGISDLMTRYIGGQAPGAFAGLAGDVQFGDGRKEIVQQNQAVLN